jgi:hypothetical protein
MKCCREITLKWFIPLLFGSRKFSLVVRHYTLTVCLAFFTPLFFIFGLRKEELKFVQ